MSHPDKIAHLVLSTFTRLPRKTKPRAHPNGKEGWTVLSGIVLSHNLPTARGTVLHDCHAEILAIRAFNRFLVDECAKVGHRGKAECDTEGDDGGEAEREVVGSKWVIRTPEGSFTPFTLREGVEVWMYTSQAPCGDVSMEVLISASADDTPWESAPATGEMPGRGYFNALGVVRRKPARADAPVCWSKSCSDKLAVKQWTSLISGMVGLLVCAEGCFLEGLIWPKRELVPAAVTRAFVDRFGNEVRDQGFHPVRVEGTEERFDFEYAPGKVSCNLSVVWTPDRLEVLVKGVLQGRKQGDPLGASCLSRMRLWRDLVAAGVVTGEGTYGDVKWKLREREMVKKGVRESLKGWKRNTGDEEWGL